MKLSPTSQRLMTSKMNQSAFHIRFKASNACETAKMVEDFGH